MNDLVTISDHNILFHETSSPLLLKSIFLPEGEILHSKYNVNTNTLTFFIKHKLNSISKNRSFFIVPTFFPYNLKDYSLKEEHLIYIDSFTISYFGSSAHMKDKTFHVFLINDLVGN